MSHPNPPTADDLRQAATRIEPFIVRTPVLQNDFLDRLAGVRVYFKCENLQRIGAFKARGAFNACLKLTGAQREKGVATHSSGNHAQALALAAKTLGMKAYIVMPSNSPAVKKNGVAELGAEIIECESTQAAREQKLEEVVARTGATFIPPYDYNDIIAGQSTAAQELIQEVPGLDVILAPVGGGGLLSGTLLAAHYFSPGTAVYGCEPALADDAQRSFSSGHIEQNDPSKQTIADGLRTTLGELTFPIIRQHAKGILTVEENLILPAMFQVWQSLHVIIEPSSAVPVAALLQNKNLFAGKKVGVIFSGGNVDIDKYLVRG